MDESNKKRLEEAKRLCELRGELTSFAKDCAEMIKTPEFWRVGKEADELSLMNDIKTALECFSMLVSQDFADTDSDELKALANLYEGRGLLSFTAAAFPKLIDNGAPTYTEDDAPYVKESCEASAEDIDKRIEIIGKYLALTEHSSRPVFPSKLKSANEMENRLFAIFRDYALRAMRFSYDSAIEKFNLSYRTIRSDESLATGAALSALTTAERATAILWRLMLRSFDHASIELILIILATLYNNCASTYHNLALAQERADRNGEKAREYRLKEEKSKARLWTCNALSKRYLKKPSVMSFISSMAESHSDSGPMRHLDLFATSLELGGDMLESFLAKEGEAWLKHCYNGYAELKKRADDEIISQLTAVADYLIRTLFTESTRRILYHSNFYETLGIEYCFSRGYCEGAREIIYNGYDYYLELGTLYLIYKYDRQRFATEVGKLKAICLRRNIAMCAENFYSTKRYIRELYGDEFVDEFLLLARKALDSIDPNDADDVRNRDARLTPEWAKKKPKAPIE